GSNQGGYQSRHPARPQDRYSDPAEDRLPLDPVPWDPVRRDPVRQDLARRDPVRRDPVRQDPAPWDPVPRDRAPARRAHRREPDDSVDAPSWRSRVRAKRKNMPLWQELPLLLIVAFCLAVLIRTFLVQAFYIPSGSMEQTLLVGDRVLVNKILYDVS